MRFAAVAELKRRLSLPLWFSLCMNFLIISPVESLHWLRHQAALAQLSGVGLDISLLSMAMRSPRKAEPLLSVKHCAFTIGKSVTTWPNTSELEMGRRPPRGTQEGTPRNLWPLCLVLPWPCLHVWLTAGRHCGRVWGLLSSEAKPVLCCQVATWASPVSAQFIYYHFILFIYLAVWYSLWALQFPTQELNLGP